MPEKSKLIHGLVRDEKEIHELIGEFNGGIVQEGVIGGITFRCWYVVAVQNLLGEIAKAREYAELGAKWAVIALFGEWRPRGTSWNPKTEQREPWGSEEVARRDFYWIPSFYLGLASACSIDDHEAVRQIARYTDGTRLRHVSSTGAEYRDESVDLYENYSDLILDRPLRRGGKHSKLEKPVSKRAQLLGKCVAAIASKNIKASVEALMDYASYHKRHGIDKYAEHVDYISPDATIFDYLIRRMEGGKTSRETPSCVLRLAADTSQRAQREGSAA